MGVDPLTIPLRPILIFVVVLARVAGLVTFAPFWSHKAAVPQVRVALALAMAFVVAPAVSGHMATPPVELGQLSLVILGEAAIGLAFGFVARLVFSALEIAAEVIGFQMGFSLASTIDPATRAQTAAFGTIAQMLGLMVLLGADGHHWMLEATVTSFDGIGAGGFRATPELADLVIRLSADAFAVGVALAAPAIVILLVVEIALAVAGRAAPQLQIMLLGFPVKIAVGLCVIGASLYSMPAALRAALGVIKEGLARAIAAM